MESAGGSGKFALRESIKLDRDTELPGSVVEVLACHQLDGIRFIHRGLKQNRGVILNDESGLGKTHQVVGYLSAAISSTDKGVILCNDLERIHHWVYHLELLTKLTTVVLRSDSTDQPIGNQQIILSTFEDFPNNSKLLLSKENQINLLIVDETKDVQLKQALLTIVAKFTTTTKLFLVSCNILEDYTRLSSRLNLCQVQFHTETLKDLLEEATHSSRPLAKSQKLRLYFLTRSVLLRRYRSHHRNVLPLIDAMEYETNFAAWKIANGNSSQTAVLEDSQTLGEQTVEQAVEKVNSEELFEFDLSRNRQEVTVEEREFSLNRAILGEAGESSGLGRDLSHDSDEGSGIALAQKQSEPLFDFEHSTEEMSQLVVETSDSESKSAEDGMKMLQFGNATESEKAQSEVAHIEVPETERPSQTTEPQTDSEGYLEFGQALLRENSQSESSAGTTAQKPDAALLEEKYDFPIERLLQRDFPSSSSTDIEVVSKENTIKNQPIIVSSSSSNGAAEREKSPDLFSDSEEELNETVQNTTEDSLMNLLLKSPHDLDRTSKPEPPAKPSFPRFPRTNVSTPISKLLHAQLQTNPNVSAAERSSSNDIFADLTIKPAASADPNRTDNVFEITDNNAFGNKILVHAEKDSMSPLRDDDDDSDDVKFVSVVQSPQDEHPVAVIDLDSQVCTPKSQNARAPNLAKRTPSSKGSSKGSPSSTPRGWLTKSSRASDCGGSPKTPLSSKKSTSSSRRSAGGGSTKRKKLENWFLDDDDDDFVSSCERASTSVNRRKSAPAAGTGSSSSSSKKISPRKKCFQERILQRYNQLLVSPGGTDSDFE